MVSSLVTLDDRSRLAVTDGQRSLSFEQLNERANRLLHGLRDLGVQPEDHLAVLTGNTPEFFEVATAAGHGGIRYVPLNWHWTAEELAYVLEDAAVSALIVDGRFLDVAIDAVQRANLVALSVFVIGADTGPFASYDELLARSSPVEPDTEAMGGPMFYTSGTTGRPKGVKSATARKDGDIVWPLIGKGLVAGLRMPIGGVQLLCGPVYHTAQWSWTVPTIFAGNTVVMCEGFDAVHVLELIDRWQVTGLHMVPTQFIRLLAVDAEVRDRFDGSSLAAVWHGAAPCPPDVKRRMLDWWGPKIWEYYGGTEGGVLTTVSPADWSERPGTVGRVSAGYEVVVTDEDGAEVPTGEPGQIWFRRTSGEQFEYHNAPEKTAASRRNGYATLGDVGYFDEDGYLYLSDRVVDMVISGGVNIYPAEIEHCLISHPAVVDVAVIGVPDDEFGEQVKAVIELAAGVAADDSLIASLDAHARQHIAGYKVPRSFDFVDRLPRLEAGKLLKRELRMAYSPEPASG